MHRAAIAFLLLFSVITFVSSTALTQTTSGRWALGITGGLNIWVNDVYGTTPSPGVIAEAQYGISNAFTAGFSLGFESLKSKSSDLRPGQPFPYMKLHAIPATFDLFVNLLEGEIIAPYVTLSAGALAYQLIGAGGVGLPDRQFRTSFLARLGVGVQAYRSDEISVIGEIGYVTLDDALDRSSSGAFDGYMFGRVGVKLHFGEILQIVETPVQTTAPLPILVIR